VLGRNAFHRGAVGSFTVARIAGHHAVLVQEVQGLTAPLDAHYEAFARGLFLRSERIE
jgi:hypothetical protein